MTRAMRLPVRSLFNAFKSPTILASGSSAKHLTANYLLGIANTRTTGGSLASEDVTDKVVKSLTLTAADRRQLDEIEGDRERIVVGSRHGAVHLGLAGAQRSPRKDPVNR